MDNVTLPRELVEQVLGYLGYHGSEYHDACEALRTALSQPQQCNETPTTLPSEASKVKEERTCSFCKHHDDAKNYDETCWGCSTFYGNKWEPRT